MAHPVARPDPVPLVLKLEDQGLSDAQITSALTNMGFSKREARDAISAAGLSSGAGTLTPAGGEGKTRPEPPAGPPPPATPTGGAGAGGSGGFPSFGLPSGVSPTLRLPTSMPSASDLASLLAGLLAYTLFLNYMRYGPAGVTGWFRAKFMNDPLDTVTARLEADGSKLQAPQIGGSDALGQLLEQPFNQPSADAGIDTGPVAPSAANTLNT